MRATDVLTAEEIRAFTRRSDSRGWIAVATTWAMIAGSLATAATWPTWPVILAALVLLGGRQLALAILTHDCAHYSLFATNKLNDRVGKWLCGAPVWLDLARYRVHHLQHHQYAGTERDPDLDLVAMYPTTRGSMARKLARDLLGVTGLKRFYGLILMDLGVLRFTVSSRVERERERAPRGERLRLFARRLAPVLLTNTVMAAACALAGHAWVYGLWPLAYVTTFSAILRLRSIAEHACTEMDPNPVRSTRTTLTPGPAGWLARVTVAPHRVNYHLEHHLLMATPYFRLPELHRRLDKQGVLKNAFVARNYVQVLKQALKSGMSHSAPSK